MADVVDRNRINRTDAVQELLDVGSRGLFDAPPSRQLAEHLTFTWGHRPYMDHAAFGRVLEKIVKLLGDGAVDRVVKFEAVPFRE